MNHTHNKHQPSRSYALEQGQTHRANTSAQIEGDLGDPDTPSVGQTDTGACLVQSRHRQQAARL